MNKRAWLVYKLLMAALALTALLAGCMSGSGPEASRPSESDADSASNSVLQSPESLPAARPIVLGFSQLGSESDWRKANTLSIREAAAEAGIRLLFENAEQSQQKQIEAVRSFIKWKVDVIAIAPVVETGWEQVLQEAKRAGIPVIITDRKVDVSDPSLFVSLIGSDFYAEGEKAAKYLLDKVRDEKGPVKIAELRGTEGSSPSIERGKGFRETIARRPDLTVIRSEPADFTFAKGKEVMRSFLQEAGNDIRVLFAHNDDMALGAVEAIEEHGLVPGKDIIIISVDGTRKGFERMLEGKINCIVECNPLLGQILMQAVKELSEGRPLPKRIETPESVFTEGMAAEEIANRKY